MPTVGEYRIVFDPPGYYRVLEPGFEYIVRGDELARWRAPDGQPFLKPVIDAYWNPPGSRFLLPYPKQFDARWWNNPLSENYIAYKDRWTFSPDIDPATITEPILVSHPEAAPGLSSTATWYKSMELYLPATFAPVLDVDWGQINSRSGVPLPNDGDTVNVFAKTKSAMGVPGNQAPYLERLCYPQPFDFFAFGFGALMLLFYNGFTQLWLDKSKAIVQGGTQDWVLINSYAPNQGVGAHGPFKLEPPHTTRGILPSWEVEARANSLAAIPVGAHDLWLGDQSSGQMALARHEGETDLLDKYRHNAFSDWAVPGPWWMAAAPKQRIIVQAQVVTYKRLEHARLEDPTDYTSLWFDMAEEQYYPTLSPQLAVSGILHTYEDTENTSYTHPDASTIKFEDADTGQFILATVINAKNEKWTDGLAGANGAGAFHLELEPGDAVHDLSTFEGVPWGYVDTVAPNMAWVSVKWPPKLETRPNVAFTLYGSGNDKWQKLEGSAGLDDLGSKKAHLTLTDAGRLLLEGQGLLHRWHYPVHLEQFLGMGDIITPIWTVRARFWMDHPEFVDHAGSSLVGPLRTYDLDLVGMLDRVDASDWLYLPQILNPLSNNALPHTEVPKLVLAQRGIDVSDSNQLFIEVDPLVGQDGADELVNIPGAPDTEAVEFSHKAQSDYAPKYSEKPAKWLKRMAEEWSGWNFYETLNGQIRYERSLEELVLDFGRNPNVGFFIYSSYQLAVAGGKPGQYYQGGGDIVNAQPVGNVVKIVAHPEGGGIVVTHTIKRDLRSRNDITAFNYLGEDVVVSLQPGKSAETPYADKVAHNALRYFRVPLITRKFPLAIAPWAVTPFAVEVGMPFQAAGYPVDWYWQVKHLTFELTGNGQANCVITAKLLPPRPTWALS